jgi:hypothetical protein
VCGKSLRGTSARSTIELAITWILPFGIFLNLPYDSIHVRKFRTTFGAISNWLGSPQTALTATIFNVTQIRACHRQAKGMGREWDDAYYVLSCLNQFDIPLRGPKALPPDFYNALVFGLFRPLSNANIPLDRDQQ